MPAKSKRTFQEKQVAGLQDKIKLLEDQSVEAQKKKTREINASVDPACEKIAKRYRERIAVLSKQLGALTGK